MSYEVTKNRVLQWIGIILVMAVFAGAYWYFQVFAGYKTSTGQTGILTSGLVGIWSFDGADVSGSTATDRSGSSNTGTISGATVTQGKVGQALNFDGVDDYVTAGDPSALEFGTGDFSISFWMKTTSTALEALVTKRWSADCSAGWAINNRSADTLQITITDGTNCIDDTSVSMKGIQDGRWHHVVAAFDRDAVVSVYMDGILSDQTSSIATVGSVSNALNFDISRFSTGTYYFTGSLDEVRAYSRVLSASEIQSLYKLGQSDEVNSGASQAGGGSRLDSGLAGYWKMDDGSGTSATDASTNGNAMTLANSPTWGTGQINGAVTFGGGSDYGTATMGDIIVGSKVTTAFWYSANVSNGSTQNFYHRGSGGCAQYMSLVTGGASTDTLSFYYRDTSCGGIDNYQVSGISKNTWHHIVSTYDTVSGVLIVYVDGVQQGTTTAIPGSSIATSGTLAFADNQGGGNNYSGSLDEFRIYNRTLSADEVAQLYRLTTPTGVDTGLKGYWSFNGKDVSGTIAYDRSGAGNTGTLTNGPVVTPGKVGQALNFDGVDDYVATTATATGDIFSYSAWIKWSSGGETIIGTVFGGMQWRVVSGTGALQLLASGVGGGATSTGTISPGVWAHVVVTNDASGNVRHYINGVDVGGGTDLRNYENSAPTIGARYNGGSELFKGSIDEVRIYNRVLTTGEIQSLYASGQSDEVNTSASQAQGTGRLDSGLAGYWKLDDGSGTSATDASTNGNTGTLTNGPTWTTGQMGSAVSFDGTDDNISIGNISMYDGRDDFAITAWINLNSTSGFQCIFCKDQSGDSASQFRFSIGENGTGKLGYGDSSHSLGGNSTLSTSTWYHAVITRSSGAGYTFYLNGIFDGNTAPGSPPNTNSRSAYIGARESNLGGLTSYFNGKIDEVRFYHRSLSADEVSQLYRLTTPTGTDTSLKGYWSFNGKDLSGTTAYDRSGSGNNGTLTNGPTVTPGKVGQALMFDGTDDFLTISDTDDSKYTGSLTLCTWAKIDTGGAYRHFMGKHSSSGATQNPFDFRTDNAATPKLTLVRANTTNIGWEGPAVTLGQWKYYCVVAPALIQSAPTFYIDGVATTGTIASGAGTGAATGSGAPIVIGVRPDNAVIMDGAMDEVRIYNLELTSNEIMALYNSGR